MTAAARAAWHEGERALQARVGIDGRMAQIGPVVLRDHMPDQHRAFFAQLPFVIAGSLDGDGQPWASVLAAPPGFAHSPDPRHLRIDALPSPDEPLSEALLAGAPIGLLGIEPHTRRRNRMNGVVDEVDARGFRVEVGQSFGNCPKYIQAREATFVWPGWTTQRAAERAPHMNDAARRMLREADTFFIATAHPDARDGEPSRGVDVSHRGGRPGFVRLGADDTLTVPDFFGNFFFNTLGNIAVNPRAGLLFIDYESGDVLQLAVQGEIVWDGPEVEAFEGAQRLLRMRVTGMRWAPAALALRWGHAELSPFLEKTGRWPEAIAQ